MRCDAFPDLVEDLLVAADPDLLRTRLDPRIWSPIEYAAHLADAVRWYVGRVRCVLDESRPQLSPFDFDAATEIGEYYRRDIDQVVADLRAGCQALGDLAKSVTDDQLGRCGLGSDGSPRSVALLLARAEHELVHHELDLRRGLGLAPTK